MKNLIKWPYVYVLWSADLPTCTKVGFSANHEKREAQIVKSINETLGRQVRFKKVAFRMPWALHAEQRTHKILRAMLLSKNPVPGTSGYTEWFRCTGFWIAAMIGFSLWHFGFSIWSTAGAALFAVGFFLPLDALFLVGLVWLIQVAAFFGGLYLLAKFLILLLSLFVVF